MKIGDVELKVIDIVTFLGMLITLFTSILNLFQNKKSIYINNITRYRVSWINTLRIHIANLNELSNITNLYISTKDGSNKTKYRRELDKVISLIKLHLNFTSEFDNNLLRKIEDLKSIIESYLTLFYYKKEMNVFNENEISKRFRKTIDVIYEKRVLKEFLDIAINFKVLKNFNTEKMDLLEMKNKIIDLYINDIDLIKYLRNNIQYIIQGYENKIKILNDEIDEIVQIYLKAEWIRCKRETKMWPFSIYNEKKTLKILQEKYKEITNNK